MATGLLRMMQAYPKIRMARIRSYRGRGSSIRARRKAFLLAGVIGLALSSVLLGGLQVRAGEPIVPEPNGYRTDNYRSPVPATLAGARVIDVGEAEELWKKKAAVFIDVYPQPPKPPNLPEGTIWRTPKHESIASAHWLANVGYGVLPAGSERYFKEGLQRLTDGDRARSIVFFCLRDCWMSWNAARRAMEYGYSNVLWFPDGTDAWRELGLPVADVRPERN